MLDHSSTQLHQPWKPSSEADEPLSLYVHIPFCKTRCSYCAFNTYAGLDALIPAFVDALCGEMERVASTAKGQVGGAHTLYFGGGTPSLLEPSQVKEIINAAQRCFGLSLDAEITLEMNPGTVNLIKLEAFRAAGVTRGSVGVQSAQPSELEMFWRKHSFDEAAEAYHLARQAGFDNLSIDLIYGAPHQTRESWRDTLRTVLAWRPNHASLYSLTLEPQTLLERQVATGILPAPDSDLAADMYNDAREYCAQAGLVQYEISNWAVRGFESRHNRQYWLNRPFLGFGPGAHGAAGGVRYWNVKSVHEYIQRVQMASPAEFPFSPALEDYEVIDRELAMAETMILRLRLVQEGLNPADFEARFGEFSLEVYQQEIHALKQMKLLERDSNALRLTEQAYLVSNQVFMRFMPER